MLARQVNIPILDSSGTASFSITCLALATEAFCFCRVGEDVVEKAELTRSSDFQDGVLRIIQQYRKFTQNTLPQRFK